MVVLGVGQRIVYPYQAGSSPVHGANLLSESKHGVGASLLTKNELGSIPSRTAN